MRRTTITLALAVTLALMPAGAAVAAETAPEPTPEPTATAEPTPEPSAEPTPEPTESVSPAPAPTTAAAEAVVPAADEPPAADPAEPADTTVEVDGAELRWSFNKESNARAFAPGTFNFLSAGKVADPGSGANTLTSASQGRLWSNGRAAGWAASSGDVSLEKSNGTAYRPATWAGLSTDTTGKALGAAGGGTHSGHQAVFGNGTGEVDAEAGTATITWDGDVTLLYYSGMTFFYVSDPVLTVANGKGTVTATLSGFASSMEDMTRWEAVPARTVTIADLPAVTLDPTAKGFTVTPAYRGVALANTPEQVRTGGSWGAFPQSFVEFQKVAGAAAYWFSSGGSADALKIAEPITVSYDQDDPTTVTPPTSDGGGSPDVTNDVVQPPTIITRSVPVLSPVAPATVAAPAPAASVVAASADAPFVQAASATTMTADQLAAETAAAVWWWIGTALLTLAAGSVAGTLAVSSAASRR